MDTQPITPAGAGCPKSIDDESTFGTLPAAAVLVSVAAPASGGRNDRRQNEAGAIVDAFPARMRRPILASSAVTTPTGTVSAPTGKMRPRGAEGRRSRVAGERGRERAGR